MKVLERLNKSYSGVKSIFSLYWKYYGGFDALILSPYFHISVVFSLLMLPFWLHEDWWNTVLSVLPSVLGFTLAGFTIWLGFGDEKFRIFLSKPMKNGKSAFMGVSAAFAHFIVIQMVALLCAIWARVTDFPLPDGHWLILYMYWLAPIGHFIGFLLFIYALMTALAATMGIFRVASWYERHKKISLTNRSRVRIKLKGFKSAIKR